MAKLFTGIVVSNKSSKTIVVSVRTRKMNQKYRKQYSSSKKFMAHDENQEAELGDKVQIQETRPISAMKKFKLVKVVDKAAIVHKEPEPTEEPKTEKPEPKT